MLTCRWCLGKWNADDSVGFARHEQGCARSVTCPLCHAPPRVVCRYPGGQRIYGGHHGVRERMARG